MTGHRPTRLRCLRTSSRNTRSPGGGTGNAWSMGHVPGLDWYDPTYYAKSPRVNPSGPWKSVVIHAPNQFGGGTNYLSAERDHVSRGWKGNSAGGDSWSTAAVGAPAWFRVDHPVSGAGF